MAHAPDPYAPPLASDRQNLTSGNLFGMVAMICWAIGFPAAEFLLESWSPLALTAARFVLASLFLLTVWILIEGPRAALRAQWGRGLLYGGIGFGMGAWLMLIAQDMTDPVTVAIFVSAMPLSASLIEVVQDGRRLHRRFVLGLMASIFGGIIAATGGATPANMGLGALIAVASTLLYAWGSRATSRSLTGVTHLGRTTVTLAGGAVTTAVIFALSAQIGLEKATGAPIDVSQLWLLALFAIGSLAISQLFWIASVGKIGVALASFHINATPFYVMIVMLGLGSGWSWSQVIGAAIVCFGVVVAQRRPT